MSHAHRRPYDPGMSVEAKARKGLGGWQTAIVEHDDGGPEVGVRVAGKRVDVPRSRVRLPRETRASRRVLISVAAAAAKGPGAKLPPLSGPVLLRQGRPLPKPRGRLLAPDFLAFVRRQACASCGTTEGVQAHHHGPRPVGRKTDDYRAVPLCDGCHHAWHDLHRLPGFSCLSYGEAKGKLSAVSVDLLIEWIVLLAGGDGGPPPLEEDLRRTPALS